MTKTNHDLTKPFEKQWRERFERFARGSEAEHLVSGWSDRGLRFRLNLFSRILSRCQFPTPSRVLDLGCAAGTYVRYLGRQGHSVVGLDYSIPSLQRAIAADTQHLGCYTGGEAYNLPFADERFDLVVSIGVFQALENAGLALDEMARVLRPGGMLLVEFLNSYEVVSATKALVGRLKGEERRVRMYSPFRVMEWFASRRFESISRAGVYLPPRSLNWLGDLLESGRIIRLLESVPGLALVGAHAFFVVAKKPANENKFN